MLSRRTRSRPSAPGLHNWLELSKVSVVSEYTELSESEKDSGDENKESVKVCEGVWDFLEAGGVKTIDSEEDIWVC